MKYGKYLGFSILIIVLAASCTKKFETYEQNSNKPVTVPPSLVLSGLLADVNIDRPFSDVQRWNQFDACNYNYYDDQRYDWTGASLNFSSLKNAIKMEEEAQRIGLPAVNSYTAIGKFLRAFFYYRMTNLVGDLPLEEALKGAEDPTPAYTSQKQIFLQILQWLDEANTEMAQVITETGDSKIDGDFYFNNKSTWRKVINSFKLRVLISLSHHAGDAELNVQSRFAEILNNKAGYPVFESSADNLQYIYNDVNKYPVNPFNLGLDATRYNTTATFLNNLVELNDPRAFITAEPATKQLKAGKTPADITAYEGAPSGEDLAEMASKMSDVENAEYSLRSRSRYYANNAAEPGIIVGYAEMCFNIAEAAHRGWITEDAETWYKKGIKAALAFYGIPVDAPGAIEKVYPYNAANSQTYTIPFDFENGYYAQPVVKYTGNNSTGLEQILLQKYLAFYNNSGWEAYLNWRRTGVPEFSSGVGTGNSGRIPKRFQYPVGEQTTNADNWKNAIDEQFGGTDDINAEMWLIK